MKVRAIDLADRPPPAPAGLRLALDRNEGPNPAPAALEAFARASRGESLRRYPDATPLEAALAKRFCVAPERVVVTTGADDALSRWARALLVPGQRVLLARPSFALIEAAARAAGACPQPIPWFGGPFPRATFEQALVRQGSEVAPALVLVRPDNPTGAVCPVHDLLALAQRAAPAVALVDLAYGEYADEDPAPRWLALPNTLLVGTFSKAYGLAGLRVGYAVGPVEIAAHLRAAAGPYPVSGPALAAAEAALEAGLDSGHLAAVRAERAELLQLAARFGATALPSQANFVLLRPGRDAGAVWRELWERGIAVRRFPGRGPLEGWLRITCPGDAGDFERLSLGLTRVLGARRAGGRT